MNTADLVARVASEQNVSNDHVRKIVDAVLVAITAAAIAQEEVTLKGFGRFKVPLDLPVRAAILGRAKRSRSRLQETNFYSGEECTRRSEQKGSCQPW
jgi:nucleoid DNA-binding protein